MNNELTHHGVDGQKWGKRNGPPYPLNAEGKADLKKQRKKIKLNQKRKADLESHKLNNKIKSKLRVKRDTKIAMAGGLAAGAVTANPLAVVGFSLGAGFSSMAISSLVNAGRSAYSNSKYKKMLINDQILENAANKGEQFVNQNLKKK